MVENLIDSFGKTLEMLDSIEFKNISFSYKNSEIQAISDISLELKVLLILRPEQYYEL